MSYSKYHAKPTHADGHRFASKREALRYGELKSLQAAKLISHLELQPRFPLIVGGEVICTYVGDFRYLDENGKSVTEDVKGFKTAEYKLKRKLLLATHKGIDHREIGIRSNKVPKPASREIQEIFREETRRRG